MNSLDSKGMGREKMPAMRIVAWVVAGLLLTGSAYGFVQAILMGNVVSQGLKARPLRMDVDLSRPGRYEGLYHQTYRRAHASSLIVHLGPPPPARAPVDTQPAGTFDGHVEILDANGQSVFKSNLSADMLELLLTANEAGGPTHMVLRIPPRLPIGTYKFVLDVRRPAPALAGRKPTVIARYAICELEMMPSVFAGAASVAFGLSGGIVALVLLVGGAKRRRTRKLSKSKEV